MLNPILQSSSLWSHTAASNLAKRLSRFCAGAGRRPNPLVQRNHSSIRVRRCGRADRSLSGSSHLCRQPILQGPARLAHGRVHGQQDPVQFAGFAAFRRFCSHHRARWRVPISSRIRPIAGALHRPVSRHTCARGVAASLTAVVHSFTAKLDHPMLIISNTADPITPLTSGRELNHLMGDSARLLIQNSPGQ